MSAIAFYNSSLAVPPDKDRQIVGENAYLALKYIIYTQVYATIMQSCIWFYY